MLFNNGNRIGINRCTSAIAIDVNGCHVSMAVSTSSFVRKFQELESLNIAFFLDDLSGTSTDRCNFFILLA